MKVWTTKENKFLQKAYNNEAISKIAKTLMRSEQSIRNHVCILRKKGFAFDRVRDVTERSVSQNMMDDLEPIVRAVTPDFNKAAEKDFFKGMMNTWIIVEHLNLMWKNTNQIQKT